MIRTIASKALTNTLHRHLLIPARRRFYHFPFHLRLAALALLLGVGPLKATESLASASAPALIHLDAAQVQRYSSMHFLGTEAAARPLALMPMVNVSARAADATLSKGSASATRINAGGVPLPALEAVLHRQLFGSGRFVEAADASWRLQLLVRAYEPELPVAGGEMLPGFLRNWWAALATSMSTESAQAVVVFDVRLEDRQRAQTLLALSVRAVLPTCQSVLGVRPLELVGADDLSPGSGHNRQNRDDFFDRYHQTAIGQAALASINALVAELHDNYAGTERRGRIIGRSAEHLQLDLNERDVQEGEQVPVLHKDNGSTIGHLQIAKVTERFAYAYPVDIHSGSIAIGDRVQINKANGQSAIFLPFEYLDRCPAPKSERLALNTRAPADNLQKDYCAPGSAIPRTIQSTDTVLPLPARAHEGGTCL